ncbi:hypothetical protein ACFX2G_044207 [Malus domestica]
MVKKRKGDREHMVYPATRRRGDHDVGVLGVCRVIWAPSKSATKSAPLRLTASCALANGSSLPLSSASLLPPLALSSTGPGPSRKLMSRASQKNRLIAANSEGSYIVGRGSMGGDCLRNGMLTSHYRGVSYLVFSDDGTLLISGSEDGGYLMIIKVNRKATCACIALRSTLCLTVVVVGYGGCKAIIVLASQDHTCLERRKWEIVEKHCFPYYN